MRTSYSALETYTLCPQKYKFQEIDRIPAKKSRAAVFGTRVHQSLRYMFSRDPLFPTLDEVLHDFRERWSAFAKDARERGDSADPLSPEEEALYQEAGEKMLRNFYAKNAPWNFTVLDLESRFEVLIEDPRRKETHVLAGIIDRIDKTGDGYEVIDYKTSRRMPSQADADRDLQMSIYALGISRKWPHVKPEALTLSLYFLRHGEKLSTTRSSEAAAATAREVLRTVSEIQGTLERGERFSPKPGPHCGFCPYKPVCPAWKHLYRDQGAGIRGQDELDAVVKEYFEIVKAERKNEARRAELKTKIKAYMEAEGLDRVFGEHGVMTRSVQKRYAYDAEKVRATLEPLGKWEEALAVDEKKLKTLLASLPPEVGSAIDEARVLIREFTVLAASTKPVSPPSPPPTPTDASQQ